MEILMYEDLSPDLQVKIAELNVVANNTRRAANESKLKFPLLSNYRQSFLSESDFNPTKPVKHQIAVFCKVREVNGLGRYIFSHIENSH